MRREHLYLGKGGQLAVMAEIAVRNYNVAIPEIDVGDDIFVVRDADGELWRVQVKTARATVTRDGYLRAQFSVSRRQLERPYETELYYSFVIRHADRWHAFINVPQTVLRETLHRLDARAGSEDGKLTFTLRCTPAAVLCGRVDLQRYRDNWEPWPLLRAA
jgi:hypothetical protein